MEQMDVMKPTPSLLAKLGSIAVHVDEYLSPHGHDFDRHAMNALLNDAEVDAWLTAAADIALVPRKRDA